MTCAPDDDLLLEGEILVQNVAQGEDLRLALVIHKGQHVDRKARLHGGLGKETVQDHLGIGVSFQLDDHAHSVAVRLVAQIRDPLEALFVHLVGDVLDELALVDLVGQLRHDDAGAALAVLLKLRAGAHDDLAAAGEIRLPDPAAAHDDAPGGKVRPGDVLHEIGERGLGVIQHADAGVDDLGEIMGRDIRRHADRDARGAVYEQVRELGGQDAGLLARLVKVGVPVHGLLVDVAQHLVGDLRHARLRVTVGGRGVAVHGAEVAVPVDEHVAHRKALREAHHRVIDRGVAVRVIAAQHVAHAGGGLLEGLVRGEPVLVERVEDAPVHGL